MITQARLVIHISALAEQRRRRDRSVGVVQSAHYKASFAAGSYIVIASCSQSTSPRQSIAHLLTE